MAEGTMKKLALIFVVLMVLSGCATTGGSQSNAATAILDENQDGKVDATEYFLFGLGVAIEAAAYSTIAIP
jgi:hypothetical protein